MNEASRILIGDVRDGLRSLPAGSVHCCVTSPPYWGLRDYGVEGQIGLEPTPDAFVGKMVEVFREVRRVLREDGTLWLNLGDSYMGGGRGGNPDESEHRKQATNAGSLIAAPRWSAIPGKPKDLCMMPWRVALALQADGWWIRSVIVWAKKSPMPESVTDRPTSSWEPIFLLAKNERYWYDAEAVREDGEGYGRSERFRGDVYTNNRSFNNSDKPENAQGGGAATFEGGRNQRNVWHLGPEPFSESLEIVHWLPVEAGASGDGIRRTPSEGCPVHGCQDSRLDGERAGDQTTRSPDSVSRPESGRHPVRYASSLNLGELDRVHSWDCACQLCSQTASERSTQSRKTDRAPATTSPCTPCDQTGSGTPDTSKTLSDAGPRLDTHENTPSAGVCEGGPANGLSEGTTCRSGSMCTCEYHRRYTKKTDHFATFPTEIPRRAIKAGTSEKGCCPTCGAGWVRVLDRQKLTRERPNEYTKRAPNKQDALGKRTYTGFNERYKEAQANTCSNTVAGVATRTTGWRQSCQCPPAEPVPCTVLDPFLGSGTTVAVARRLGRHGVGCELNPEYAELARIRIGKAEKPDTFVDPRAKDSPLFQETP